MNKTLLVARREYVTTVRRKGFIIATFGFPLFIVAIYAVIGGAALFSARQAREKVEKVGLVDESGLIQWQLLPKVSRAAAETASKAEEVPPAFGERARREARRLTGTTEVLQFKSREEALRAYMKKEIRGFFTVPRDFLSSGQIRLDIKMGAFMSDSSPGWDVIRRLATASLVEGKLDEASARRVWQPAGLTTTAINDQGLRDQRGQFAEVSGFVVPYVFAIFFMLSIMSSAGYLMQGVSEEKENRVIEVLISSVTPEELLTGKIFGLCGAGLTQVGVWIMIGVIPAAYLLPFLDLRWDQLIAAAVFFPLGFFLFGSLMGSTASLGNNFRESQQASMVWSLSSVAPMFVMPAILSQPNGAVARVLSNIPLTAPLTIMMRVGAAPVAWWEIAVSAAVMLLSLHFILKAAARLFRIGTLMYGKRPSLVEIVRWMRAS